MGDPSTFTVTYDVEFDASQKRGAWLSYRAKKGKMTLLNFTPEYGKLKAFAFTADCLPGPRIMEGYSHMLLKPSGDVITLYNSIVKNGLMQHWGTVHGDITAELDHLTRQLSLDLIML